MLDTTNLLWYGSIAVEFLFCLYLVWTKLAKSYPVFTVCLGCSVLRSLAAMYFMRGAVGARSPRPIPISGFGPSLFGCCCSWPWHWKCTPRCGRITASSCGKTRPLLLFALLIGFSRRRDPAESRAGSCRAFALDRRDALWIPGDALHFQRSGDFSGSFRCSLFGRGPQWRNAESIPARRNDGGLLRNLRDRGFLDRYGLGRPIFVNGYFVSALTLCFVAVV